MHNKMIYHILDHPNGDTICKEAIKYLKKRYGKGFGTMIDNFNKKEKNFNLDSYWKKYDNPNFSQSYGAEVYYKGIYIGDIEADQAEMDEVEVDDIVELLEEKMAFIEWRKHRDRDRKEIL